MLYMLIISVTETVISTLSINWQEVGEDLSMN